MRDRSRFALLLLTLALAACGGGQESSADAPASGARPGREDAAPPPDAGAPAVVAGGDTAVASAPTPGRPGAPSTGGPAASPPAPVQAGGTPATTPPAAPAQPNREDAAAILRRVEQRVNGIRTLEADFVQVLTVPLLDQTQRSAGKLYQKRPDRFLMRFSQPAGDVMVADGRHFWIYYPSSDKTQVIRTGIAEAGETVDLQRQFLGDPNARFAATLEGRETVDGHATHVLTLVPRRQSPYRRLKVWVDTDDFLVRRFEMTEENDSVRRLELRNLRVNGSVADALFAFTPPAGTQVIDQ